jgi:Protein of unknown function (DUF433)
VDYRRIITIEPGNRGGKPCIRGLRITVYDVLGYLASGMSEDEIQAIASKDSDLVELSVLRGEPPKLVWIRRGNCSSHEIVALLKARQRGIEALAMPDTARLYIIE